jgi:hypothetical protein
MMIGNQVPATWFASDAGIRRLVSPETGPSGARFRIFRTFSLNWTIDPRAVRPWS